MGKISNAIRVRLLAGAAAGVLVLGANTAWAQAESITIPAQPLADALLEFANQTGRAIMFTPAITASKGTAGVSGVADQPTALTQLLTGTGLTYRREGEAFVIVQQQGGSGPQDASAGGDVEALIVTAQKREEAIQDVPIAISAFSQKALEEQKIEGGFDLLKAIPNVTFSKSNFTSYNFSIRGVGTKAISATTDPGVAVSFNNTALIQNRLFEQEYFDVERVEVLRGPQGTLYGRNATSGVINVISAKPDLNEFEASLKLEVGNYDTQRVVGMVNIPVIEDVLGVRLAGAMTQRSGYDFNTTTQNAVNGRDLWSGRVTVGFEPNERFRSNLIWEHFEEDDDRSRTGKQLCKRDPGPLMIRSQPVVNPFNGSGALTYFGLELAQQAYFSQGCQPVSLYDDAAFGTPNGLALPFVNSVVFLRGNTLVIGYQEPGPGGFSNATNNGVGVIFPKDPYGGLMQSRNLREIASVRDPIYRAKADVIELSWDFDLTPELTFTSQTAYNEDETYSFQDFNRFNSVPIFTDTTDITHLLDGYPPGAFRNLSPRPVGSPVGTAGVFCDPQIGCSDSIAGFDISKAVGKQFSQEFRLQSDFDGPVNFSAGVNYTTFETLVDYYVMYNLLTALAMTPPFTERTGFLAAPNGLYVPGYCTSSSYGAQSGLLIPADNNSACPYIDLNPLESIDGEGHNYFRSKNPYKLKSWAGFGEAYWNVTDALKVTAGLRYTADTKTFIPVPSQILMAKNYLAGGYVSKGYPEDPPIVQNWGEFTGRLGVDWKPALTFTDQTLLYAFYSRGYKAGGANPPSPGFGTKEQIIEGSLAAGITQSYLDLLELLGGSQGYLPPLTLTAVEYGPTFEPEFVDAFEVGAKNTLLGGALTFNATAFFYDYKDYQVSQIRDRTAVNENFDATIWGLEFETTFNPTRNLRINANLGYLDTKIADGEASIDIMNRTQSDPNYTLVKPWLQLPSNCVVPTAVIEAWLASRNVSGGSAAGNPFGFCGGVKGSGAFLTGFYPDPAFGGQRYDYRNYPELNGGAGIKDQLGGNELPNAPHWTSNVGAQYGLDLFGGSWRATVRGDAYWQSQSFARVYNAVNDKLHGWYNVNLSMWLEQPELGLKIEVYAKNILDDTPITDAFLNSDDTALTTNIFTLDPRIVGLSVRKEF